MQTSLSILPPPKEIQIEESSPLLLGMPGLNLCAIVVPENCSEMVMSAAYKLENRLGELLGYPPAGSAAVQIRLKIGRPPAHVANAAQGYCLTVRDHVEVTGFGEEGLCFGITTLLQCLELESGQVQLPQMRILDWPDIKFRGQFLESRFGTDLMDLSDWQALVDRLESMKMNHLVISLYGCWSVQYDRKVSQYLFYPLKNAPQLKTPVITKYYSPSRQDWIDRESLPPLYAQDFLCDLIAYGKTRGVQVIPMVNSFGHNNLFPSHFPEASAKTETGEPALTGFCTSNPETYRLLFDFYDDIISRCLIPNQIDGFHIGLDEIFDGPGHHTDDIFRIRSPWCKCSECQKKSRAELYMEHAVRLIRHLKSRGMKTVYMCYDMLIPHAYNTGTGDILTRFQAMLRQENLLDVTVVDWWSYSNHLEQMNFQAVNPDIGLRCSVKPWNGYFHYSFVQDAVENVFLLAQMAHNGPVEELQAYCAPDLSYRQNDWAQAAFSWNFSGTGGVEGFRQLYADRWGRKQPAKFRRALDLLNAAASTAPGKASDVDRKIDRYTLLFYRLSYYVYSYVSTGKPYPRRFPGEAMTDVLDHREDYRAMLGDIAALARESRQQFSDLAQGGQMDGILAARYAYEAENIQALAEDFLALIRMDELARVQNWPEIRQLARARAAANLDLLARLETTKEPFLLASQMRNHSIVFQYFTDLVNYLEHTPEPEVTLDFTDNTHFASERFWQLR